MEYWKDVGLGKGAWQCDASGGREILPQDEATVFEELPSAHSPRFALLPSVPTVAARTDDRHVAVFSMDVVTGASLTSMAVRLANWRARYARAGWALERT